MAGGPRWSTRAIVRELKKRDLKTFDRLSHTTINGWIDRSGSKPKWAETFMACLQHGNEPGHSKGGQRGILVSYKLKSTVITINETNQYLYRKIILKLLDLSDSNLNTSGREEHKYQLPQFVD